MGWCLTWFAVKGKSPEIVRSMLGVHLTGEMYSFQSARTHSLSPKGHRLVRFPRIVGAQLPGNWYLVQRCNYECRDDTVLSRLSAGCEAISLFIEEHVMVCNLSSWKDGKRLWSVIHNSEKGDQHLEADGDLPSDFVLIRDEICAKWDQLPYTEIPVQLAAKLTGYQHDAHAKREIAFEVLARPSLWKRIFQL